jgi:hypothetical protein
MKSAYDWRVSEGQIDSTKHPVQLCYIFVYGMCVCVCVCVRVQHIDISFVKLQHQKLEEMCTHIANTWAIAKGTT